MSNDRPNQNQPNRQHSPLPPGRGIAHRNGRTQYVRVLEYESRVHEIRQALQEEGNQFVVITEMIPVSPKKRVARYRIEKKQTQ